MKNNCIKFNAWLEKKDISISYFCYESNMIDISSNTWWIDFGSTIHISNILQGFLNQRKPMGSEKYIYLGNKIGSQLKL